MKLVQTIKPGICEAMRCGNVATSSAPLAPFLEGLAPTAWEVLANTRPGKIVGLCARCQAKAVVKFGERAGSIEAAPGATALVVTHVTPTPKLGEKNEMQIVSVIPTASVEAEIAANKAYAEEQIEVVEALGIETQEDFDLFAELLAEVKGKLRAVTARKEEITKPLNTALASARALFRPAENALAEAEAKIKSAIGAFTLRAEAQRKEAMRLAAEAHAKGDAVATSRALESMVTPENTKGVSTRRVWRYEVTKAEEVPRAFLSVDDKLVKAFIAIHEGEPTHVPGLRFFEDTIVSSRSAS